MEGEANDYLQNAFGRFSHYLGKNINQLDRSDCQQIQSLQSKLKNHVFEIAAFGLSSCGKTAVLNALQVRIGQTPQNIGQTSPLHGTTVELSYSTWDDGIALSSIALDCNDRPPKSLNPPKVQIKLIDTPGLDEVDGELRAKIAIAAARQADLILFVTAGDLTRLELEAIAQLQQAYKPILLICNKVDLYPQRDRQLIYQALQDPELQALISTDEIIFTSAAPMPRRVRLEYADRAQEIWESPAIEITDLKQKILDLLNQDGKALLALNVLRSLWEIQTKVRQKRLDWFPPQRTIASGIFIIKAISILLSPSSGLDLVLSIVIDGGAIVLATTLLGSLNLSAGMSLSITSAIVLANIHSHYGQIIWVAMTTPWLIDWIVQDLQKPHAINQFIKNLRASSPQNSILIRLNFFKDKS